MVGFDDMGTFSLTFDQLTMTHHMDTHHCHDYDVICDMTVTFCVLKIDSNDGFPYRYSSY